MSNFTATTHQNEYVAIGATEVEAIVTVECGQRADAVQLRLWTPRHTTVECFTQVRPTIEDLGTGGTRVSDHVVDHRAGRGTRTSLATITCGSRSRVGRVAKSSSR